MLLWTFGYRTWNNPKRVMDQRSELSRGEDQLRVRTYVTELRERLEDSLKLAQEELQKSQKRYKKYYDKKAKPRCL